MFTGIISDVVAVKGSQPTASGLLITFTKPASWGDLKLGESIATDGVCLTVAAIRDNEYDCLLIPETLEKTSFGAVLPEKVNLERALSVASRLDGHFVQGHVDGTGTVSKIDQSDGHEVFVDFDTASKNLVIQKGSIAINGVSLTVASIDGDILSVALIPHTLQHTTLGNLAEGSVVNLEFDMIGKYIVKIMDQR